MSSVVTFVDKNVLRGGAGLFLVWWSAWSLMDVYLIPRLSPWSELVVLSVGVVLLYRANKDDQVAIGEIQEVERV